MAGEGLQRAVELYPCSFHLSLFWRLCTVFPYLSCPAACALEIDADVLMPALNRSLDAMKQPAARVSVMEFVVLFMGVGRVAGLPTNTTHLRWAHCGTVRRVTQTRQQMPQWCQAQYCCLAKHIKPRQT